MRGLAAPLWRNRCKRACTSCSTFAPRPVTLHRFACWMGCCLVQGGFQYYLYNHLFVKWCAGMTAVLGHKGSAPIKTFIDQAIQ